MLQYSVSLNISSDKYDKPRLARRNRQNVHLRVIFLAKQSLKPSFNTDASRPDAAPVPENLTHMLTGTIHHTFRNPTLSISLILA